MNNWIPVRLPSFIDYMTGCGVGWCLAKDYYLAAALVVLAGAIINSVTRAFLGEGL